jgi:hypothetical protein
MPYFATCYGLLGITTRMIPNAASVSRRDVRLVHAADGQRLQLTRCDSCRLIVRMLRSLMIVVHVERGG